MVRSTFKKKMGKKVALTEEQLMQKEEPITADSFVNRFRDLSPRAEIIEQLRSQKIKQKKIEMLERLVHKKDSVSR